MGKHPLQIHMDFPATEIKQGILHGLSLPQQGGWKNPDGHLSTKPSPCKESILLLCYLLTPEPAYESNVQYIYVHHHGHCHQHHHRHPAESRSIPPRHRANLAQGGRQQEAASMDAVRGTRTFEDFDPVVGWSRTGDADSVKISLPGFKREEIRVLVDNHGHLRTRGERPVAGTRWARFQKDFKLPDNCNVDGIRAKFESETLTITLPKKSPSPQVAAAAPVPAPAPPMPEPRRPAAAPPQRPPPAALPEPARPAAPPTVPAVPLVPAPSQKPPAERRPSLPSRLPSVRTPAELEQPKKPEPVLATVPKAEEFVKQTKKAFLGDAEEKKRMEREAMGKMEEDRKMMEEEKKKEQPKEEAEGPLMGEMGMETRPRPMAANRGLLVNVAVAVVVLVGITAYVWHSLKNATGDHGHGGMGAGSYGDEM